MVPIARGIGGMVSRTEAEDSNRTGIEDGGTTTREDQGGILAANQAVILIIHNRRKCLAMLKINVPCL